MNNLLKDLPEDSGSEVFETLIHGKGIKLERIVSFGQATPAGDWLSSEQDEWVLVVSGAAKLVFEGKEDLFVLSQGDYLLIPAHTRHRVEWTDTEQPTVWLAFHY